MLGIKKWTILCVEFVVIIITFIVIGLNIYNSLKILPKDKIYDIIEMCCENSTSYPSNCDFMEKYGCESNDITKNQFTGIIFDYIFINILGICICTISPVLYNTFTKKMLENEGKIPEETIEEEKISNITMTIRTKGIDLIKKELMKNPYERNCYSTTELSVYHRKFYIITGMLSVLSYIII